jgi:hypothetical protein
MGELNKDINMNFKHLSYKTIKKFEYDYLLCLLLHSVVIIWT